MQISYFAISQNTIVGMFNTITDAKHFAEVNAIEYPDLEIQLIQTGDPVEFLDTPEQAPAAEEAQCDLTPLEQMEEHQGELERVLAKMWETIHQETPESQEAFGLWWPKVDALRFVAKTTPFYPLILTR
jgi:hypothetical protein